MPIKDSAVTENLTSLKAFAFMKMQAAGEMPFRKMYGKDPVVQGLHAGVECGLFSGKLPGLDCVSYGPDMKDIHTPKESMCVESVKRTWDFTLEVLKQL